MSEADISENDLIIVPGQMSKRSRGFVPRGTSRVDHEVAMAKSDLVQCVKNSKQIHRLIKDISEQEGLEGWVQEKITKAEDYLNTVREYLEGKQQQVELEAANPAQQAAIAIAKKKELGVAEGAVKTLSMDLTSMSDKEFIAKYKKTKAEARASLKGVSEESEGLWANIHAKRERIKHGSGERMRKPGSKGAPTKDALRKSAK
jgi:hypothetical protein